MYSINRVHIYDTTEGKNVTHSLIHRNLSWDGAMEYLEGLCHKAATRGFIVTNTEFGKFSCQRCEEMFVFEIVTD